MKKRLRQIWRACSENLLAEQPHWMAWIPVLFATGIGVYFLLPFEPNYWLSLLALEILLLLFYLLRFHNLHMLFISLLTILAGFINIQMHSIYSAKRVSFSAERITYIRGRLADISYNEKGKERLLLVDAEDEEKPLKGKYRITLTGNQHFKVNQCVELVGTIFPPSPIPVLEGFQLNRKYFYDGLSAIGYANSEVFEVDCQKQYSSSTFKSRLNALRKDITDDIAQILPEEEAGVVDAVLIGEQTRIPKNIHENYRDSGLAHFLSVSGLHLGAIAGLVFFALRLLLVLIPGLALRYDNKKIAAIGAIAFSALYLLVSGMAIPAERAFIMTAVVLVGVIFNRQAISLRMVSFAAMVILVISPESLVSISFQMSFAAVVALIAFYERYAATIAAWGRNHGLFAKIIVYLAGIVICDFVASLATTPFAIYHFHRIAVYTSLGNLLAGPLIGLCLMPLILLCLVTLPLGLAYYPLKALGAGIGILNQITRFVAELPYSVAVIDSLTFSGFILIIFGGCWLCIWQRPWRKWGILLIIIGILSMFFAEKPDVVFAEKGKGIAVRDNIGNMVLLPKKVDNFVKKVWQENLRLVDLDKGQKEKLKDIYVGHREDLAWLDLKCDKKGCTYKEKIYFSKKGRILLNGKKIDNSAGGYIYLSKEKVMPLYNNKQCRLWQMCVDKKEGENNGED